MIGEIKIKHPHHEALKFQDHSFHPGENGVAKLNVGRLPSGETLTIIAHVFRSINEGPTLLLLGGIHGDEINGIKIITNILEQGILSNIKLGSVIAIPLLNVFGFNNLSRDLPDGKDVNRSFPGSTGGSLASRLARTLTKHIMPYVDYALDLHTGGAERYNYAQTRYSKSDQVSQKMADIFNAPFSIQQPLISNSFRKVAKEMSCHAIVYEGGESVRINQNAIKYGIDGCMRIMAALGMVTYNGVHTNNTVYLNKTSWIRASQPGIFIWIKKSGEKIEVGDHLGDVSDPYGLKTQKIISKGSGYIIGHNNAAVVNQGDPLFHIGIKDEKAGF